MHVDRLEAGLVEGPGHCAECHSPRNVLGAIIEDKRFSGGPDAEGKGWFAKIKLVNKDELSKLMDAAAYRKFVEDLG